MAIEKFGNGANQDFIKIKGSGERQSLAVFVQDVDAGGTDAIEETFQGANSSMVITSGGNTMSLSAYVNYVDGGGTDTITGQMIGAYSNIVVDSGVMKSLAEKQSGSIQVMEEEAEIALQETEGTEKDKDPEVLPLEMEEIPGTEKDKDPE